MKPEIKALARHRMSPAREAFAEGDHLLTKGSPIGAVNRFYYAAFYAARALLAIKEADSSRHSGVISLLQKYFVSTGQVSTTHARRCRARSKSARTRTMLTLPRLLQKRLGQSEKTCMLLWKNVWNCLSAC